MLAVISDITQENEVQIQFLSNGVRMKGSNTISLAAQLMQNRSFMIVLFALIVMLRDSQPSSFDTSLSLTP